MRPSALPRSDRLPNLAGSVSSTANSAAAGIAAIFAVEAGTAWSRWYRAMLVHRVLPICLMLYAAAAAAQPALPPMTAPQGTPLGAPEAVPSQSPPAAVPPQSPPPSAVTAEPPTAPALPQAPSAAAEQPPARVFCDQGVAFRLDAPASTPDSYRRFVGIWSDAAWDARTCAALIVQRVEADGKASIIYVYGPEGSRSPVAGAVLRGTGIVKDGELRFQNADGSQYAFRPGIVDMVGHWINPKGESFQATFKQTP